MEDIRKLAAEVGFGRSPAEEVRKALTPSSGLVGINLERAAKLMMPIYTVLRKLLPADTPPVGAQQVTYRAYLAHGVNLYPFGSDPNNLADIGQEQSNSVVTFQVPYAMQSLNDRVGLSAIDMARGFDDAMQVSVARALTALLRLEEHQLLGANMAAIPAPTVSLTGQGTGGSIGAVTVYVRVTALTYEGWLAGSTGGASARGESVPSATQNVAFASGSTNAVLATWPSVPGAVAYNVFAGTASGTQYYVGTVTVPKMLITSVPTSGNQPNTADSSANSLMYEGLLAWAAKSSVYGVSIPNKVFVDGAAAGLTASSGIAQFDTVLQQLWEKWQTGPTHIVCSPKAAATVTSKLMNQTNALNYFVNITEERGAFTGGVFLGGYVNKFAAEISGFPRVIPVVPHPYMPDGTFLFLSLRVPYPYSREGRGFALDVLRPYTYFPLAPTGTFFPYALTYTETLKCYHPGAQAILTGIDLTQ